VKPNLFIRNFPNTYIYNIYYYNLFYIYLLLYIKIKKTEKKLKKHSARSSPIWAHETTHPCPSIFLPLLSLSRSPTHGLSPSQLRRMHHAGVARNLWPCPPRLTLASRTHLSSPWPLTSPPANLPIVEHQRRALPSPLLFPPSQKQLVPLMAASPLHIPSRRSLALPRAYKSMPCASMSPFPVTPKSPRVLFLLPARHRR
jgi:hypothetical protein